MLVPLNRTARGRGGPQPEIADMTANCHPPSLARLQAAFLTIVPRIELHGRIYFRTKHWQDRQEAIGEMVALSWRWFLRLANRGKDATQFPSVLATFAAQAVHNGRRLAGSCTAKDALSPVAQRRHGFAVGRLPDISTLNGNPLFDALHDNTRSPIPDQVIFRFDFPAWLATLGCGIAISRRTWRRATEPANWLVPMASARQGSANSVASSTTTGRPFAARRPRWHCQSLTDGPSQAARDNRSRDARRRPHCQSLTALPLSSSSTLPLHQARSELLSNFDSATPLLITGSSSTFLLQPGGILLIAPMISPDLTAFLQRKGRLPRLEDRPPPWHYRGWSLPYVIQLHALVPAVANRWGYHLRTLEAGRLLDEPIPPIAFKQPDNKVFSMLRVWSRLIGRDCGGWTDFHILLDWLSWGLALSMEEPRLGDAVQEKLYRQVNLQPLLETPYDYLGDFVAAGKAKGWNPTAFFPTPHNVVELMVQMTMADTKVEGRDPRTMSVNDPCVGSGRMLLHASNYSFNLFGQDIDPLAISMCKINGGA